MVWRTELVNKSLRPLRLLHDPLLVVLPERARQLVIVHGRPVLPLAPQRCHAVRVDDLEDPLLPVQPVDAAGVEVRLVEQLLDELPQVDVGGGAAGGLGRGG